MATGWPPGVRSSSGVKVRPRAAPTPSTGKYVPDTNSPLARSVEAQAKLVCVAAEHPGKNRVVGAEVAIHGIGERVFAQIAAVVEALHMEQDELLRVFHRHEAQQHLIEESEDGSVCADAEGQ